MFLLRNVNDREYRKVYPDLSAVIFDVSDSQLKNAKNAAWKEIKEGSIICVVTSSRKINTFYRVKHKACNRRS